MSPSDNRPWKAVQIGAGRFASEYHAPTLRRLARTQSPRIQLAAICDLSLERAGTFCREFGYDKPYTDYRRMIDQIQPDLIYVLVHPAATALVVGGLLPLRLPIFTEKPPGVTIAEAEQLAKLAEQAGTVNYVGFNRRRMPGLEGLKTWAEANGPVRHVAAEMLRNRRLEPEFAIGTAIHSLDFLRYLCGRVVRLSTQVQPHALPGAMDYFARLDFESGAIADLRVQVDCGLRRERYMAQSANASMEVTLGAGYSSSFCRAGAVEYLDDRLIADLPASGDPLVAGGFLGEHEAFLDAVATGRMPDCCLQDAFSSLRLASALQAGYNGPIDQFSARVH